MYNNGSNQTEGFYYWNNGTWVYLKSPNSNEISGPGSSTDNAMVRFDGSSGKIIQNSTVVLDDASNISGINNMWTNGFTMPGGATLGEILVSDANGNASWESAPPVDVEENLVNIVPNANKLNFTGNITVKDDGDYRATITFYSNCVTKDVIQLSSSDSTNLKPYRYG